MTMGACRPMRDRIQLRTLHRSLSIRPRCSAAQPPGKAYNRKNGISKLWTIVPGDRGHPGSMGLTRQHEHEGGRAGGRKIKSNHRMAATANRATRDTSNRRDQQELYTALTAQPGPISFLDFSRVPATDTRSLEYECGASSTSVEVQA